MAVIALLIIIGVLKTPSLGWLLLVIISVYAVLFAPEKALRAGAPREDLAGNYGPCNVRRKK